MGLLAWGDGVWAASLVNPEGLDTAPRWRAFANFTGWASYS